MALLVVEEVVETAVAQMTALQARLVLMTHRQPHRDMTDAKRRTSPAVKGELRGHPVAEAVMILTTTTT